MATARHHPAVRRDNESAAGTHLDFADVEKLFSPDSFVFAAEHADVSDYANENRGFERRDARGKDGARGERDCQRQRRRDKSTAHIHCPG